MDLSVSTTVLRLPVYYKYWSGFSSNPLLYIEVHILFHRRTIAGLSTQLRILRVLHSHVGI